MQTKTNTQKPTNGVLLESDLTFAVKLQKLALSANVILRSFADCQSVAKEVHANDPEILLIDCCNQLKDALDLISDVNRQFREIIIIAILPSDADEHLKQSVIKSGVRDFFISPFGFEEFQMRIRNALAIRYRFEPADTSRRSHEDEIRNAIGEILLREYETLHVLGKAAEYKDQETGTHIVRVARYAKLISEMIGEREFEQDEIFHSSALHDIGKIGIPDSILLKPGPLSDAEFEVMRTHTTNGHGILERSESSYLLNGALIALTHHERFDGSGYPMRLSGSEIPLSGRIVCVADVFDALTTKRPYKEPWSLDRAFAQLESQRNVQFDPDLVDAFVSNVSRVHEIYNEHRDPDDIPTVDGTGSRA